MGKKIFTKFYLIVLPFPSRGYTGLLLHIGIDDTDSPSGGCTTYIAALLVEELLALGCRFIDYPNLLRLNPNVPWKTRGNGAVCLRVDVGKDLTSRIQEAVILTVESHAEFDCVNTNPGIVFFEGKVPESLKRFSDRVVQSVVTIQEAEKLINETGTYAVGFKNMRGLIGALAAIGGLQRGDHTFELLSYRKSGNRGSPRLLDEASVRLMDEAEHVDTFNNIDPESGRVLIAPHGSDPVFYGVRGESPEAVHRASMIVESIEEAERWVIYRSNQGTDWHFKQKSKISGLRPFNPAIVGGEVIEGPVTIQGGHVIFGIKDDTGRIDCAAYEPTGNFREIVRQLIPGDGIIAYGGIRESNSGGAWTLNLEKLEVITLAQDIRLLNPECPRCGGRMESMGRDKGFRCRRCGHRERSLSKQEAVIERVLKPGLYLPPPKAQRHLTKPLKRYGREKEHPPAGMCEPWHSP